MSGFSELIKNFEKTRDYVRDFFIYGYKVRNDFSEKSSRTYDDEKRRVESWLGNILRYDNSVRGRQISISVDSGQISENPLYKAYYSKSFTDNDIALHFLISDILCSGESLCLREITDRLDSGYGILFDEQTVRNKLKEYVKEGIIETEKRGKTAYFSMKKDTAENFSDEYEGFSDLVKFFSENGKLGVIGNCMLKDMHEQNDIFLTKHNYIVHTLEDIIIPEIIAAIDEKQVLKIKSFGKGGNEKHTPETEVVPMKILISVQTGRRYLACYNLSFGNFTSLRLDYIRSVKKCGAYAEYEALRMTFEKSCNRCFGVSFSKKEDAEPLRITFVIDEENEEYVIERVNREKRQGVFMKTGENLYTLTLDICDPNEAMQWVKSFIGRIISVKGGTDEVRRTFKEDINRMYGMYFTEEESV